MIKGRPTDYSPKVIEELNQYLLEAVPQNMKIPTVEGLALRLGVVKKTIYNWGDAHEEFLHALEELKMKQKECLTEIGIFGGKEINATIVALLLKVNHDMVETERQELVGKDGQPLQLFVNAGSGFIPASVTLSSSSAGGVAEGQSPVQSAGVAPAGKENDNGDSGSSQAKST